MNYQRIYVEEELFLGARLSLSKELEHYLKKVLRLASGYKVKVFNQKCGEFLAQLISNQNQLLLEVEEFLRPAPPIAPLHLGVCLVRNCVMSQIVDQAVQLGVSSITPIISQHTNSSQFNHQRYEAIAKEAIEQSNRCDQLVINPATKLLDFVKLQFDLLILADEKEKQQDLSDIENWPQNVALLIGPEGGWSDAERTLLQESAVSISLAPNILRTETACAAALAQISLLRRIKNKLTDVRKHEH